MTPDPTKDKTDGAGLIHQAIPDVEGSEPRPVEGMSVDEYMARADGDSPAYLVEKISGQIGEDSSGGSRVDRVVGSTDHAVRAGEYIQLASIQSLTDADVATIDTIADFVGVSAAQRIRLEAVINFFREQFGSASVVASEASASPDRSAAPSSPLNPSPVPAPSVQDCIENLNDSIRTGTGALTRRRITELVTAVTQEAQQEWKHVNDQRTELIDRLGHRVAIAEDAQQASQGEISSLTEKVARLTNDRDNLVFTTSAHRERADAAEAHATSLAQQLAQTREERDALTAVPGCLRQPDVIIHRFTLHSYECDCRQTTKSP